MSRPSTCSRETFIHDETVSESPNFSQQVGWAPVVLVELLLGLFAEADSIGLSSYNHLMPMGRVHR